MRRKLTAAAGYLKQPPRLSSGEKYQCTQGVTVAAFAPAPRSVLKPTRLGYLSLRSKYLRAASR